MTTAIDETHDPALTSWAVSAQGHRNFPIQNLPLGVFSLPDGPRRCATAIGDYVLDLTALAAAGLLEEAGPASKALSEGALNALLALTPECRTVLRRQLSKLLSGRTYRPALTPFLHHASDCILHLPARIGDYTDFYVGIHHATNVGKLFRPDNPLLPNYKYVPIGYHGRASSIRTSGAPVRRPHGQQKAPDAETPVFGPSRRLDYELELGVWIGGGNGLGESIPIAEADRYIAGLCLLNDWSARDIQAWEYQPLGPFLSKNFMSTVSPWIVTADALAPFRLAQAPRPAGDPPPLDYLRDAGDETSGAYAIELELTLTTAKMRAAGLPPHRLSRNSVRDNMYWTAAQIVTHHTSNGCNLQPGDLLGTGTLSAATPDGYGSLLEISEGGKKSVALVNGETRTFLEDGDEVRITGVAHAAGFVSIGFGDCQGTVTAT
ncbi:fumarylacetoacetase [Asticcacaulis sp.]|uniref:fumarylacetoacetase n=1 Tax=Asticcacaulis sp. TaxID=1872648 RepID=UPI002B8F28D4|nr:fumarylacetoacetase [Asticcacaulis sp.]HTM81590.1 fumarylacetoacetase [Asticcacaulis sp.]